MEYNTFNPIYRFLRTVLPLSPFTHFIDSVASFPYLGWINWFFPFSELGVVMALYLTALGLYYAYIILMRWIKVIGD